MRSISAIESILSGSESVEATVRLAVGVKLTATGRETNVYASIRLGKLSASEVSQTAKDRDAGLLVILATRPLVNVSLPSASGSSLVCNLRPVMTGERAAVAFAILSGRTVPASIPADRVNAHCVACKLDVPASASVKGKGKSKAKDADVPAPIAERIDAVPASVNGTPS